MAKKEILRKVLGFVIWLTGIIVSLAVAYGMIKGVLTIPFIPQVSIIAGWIVIITTILGIVLALVDYFS
jgi:hypothetical protein